MNRGRPPMGAALVEKISGSAPAKDRVKAILETVSGQKSIPEACEKLGMGEAAFYKLRDQVLEAAVARLEPKPAGRPRKEEPEETDEIRKLKREVQDLRVSLRASQIREEIALVMPHLLSGRLNGAEKKRKRATIP